MSTRFARRTVHSLEPPAYLWKGLDPDSVVHTSPAGRHTGGAIEGSVRMTSRSTSRQGVGTSTRESRRRRSSGRGTAVQAAVEQGQGPLGLTVADQAEQQRLLDDLALGGRAADARQAGQDVGEQAGRLAPVALARGEQGVAHRGHGGAHGQLTRGLAVGRAALASLARSPDAAIASAECSATNGVSGRSTRSAPAASSTQSIGRRGRLTRRRPRCPRRRPSPTWSRTSATAATPSRSAPGRR